MDVLIKAATIIAPKQKHHLKVMDILIRKGKIKKIAPNIKEDKARSIQEEGLHVSAGWIDLHANLQDPGFEHKEDIQSGIKAASAGGFTKIAVSPLSDPIRDSKSHIEYLRNHNSNQAIDLLPYGSVSKKAEGKELAELYDMKSSGAVAFFDGKHSIKNPNLLNRALLYSKSFDGVIFNFPHTEDLAHNGVMNEGHVSTNIGLKGIPELAESLMVARDLNILEYTEGKLHFSTISSAKSVELIAMAQKQGLKVSCDVASYSLLLNDSNLEGFDSRFKTLPPLRDSKTIKALVKGIKSGTITAISSDHLPEDIESKMKELDHASFGIINLQTAFPSAYTALHKDLDLTQIVQLFTEGPASVLSIESNEIKEGNNACLTLFQPYQEFIFTKDQVKSKSKNSPFFNMPLKGKVVGTVNNGKLTLN
ncbi:MAG: dihydroorotase [Flavobacteriales bacterium]|nr:dihydroorotase [Flavobacteriales bacterium]